MCGYIGNLHQSPAVIDLFNRLNIPLPYPLGQYYTLQPCPALVTATDNGYQHSSAIWWYAMKWDNGKLVPNMEITSFNARNLNGRMWRKPMDARRGLVFATEIGETQGRSHYLMRARNRPLAIGTLWQDSKDGDGFTRSFALITRPATSSFARYHEKAMPLFLPWEDEILQHWLDPAVGADDPLIRSLVDNPRVTTDLEVTPVKTFKRGEPVGASELLPADLDDPLPGNASGQSNSD